MEEKYSPEGMLDSYLYECFQLLGQMGDLLLAGKAEDFFCTEDIQEIFRILHTIKGSSSIMMYDNIGMAAHKLEDIFYYLREAAVEELPKEKLSACLLMAADFMAEELNKIKEGEQPDGDPGEVIRKAESYLEHLKAEIVEQGGELPQPQEEEAPRKYYNAPAQKQKRKKKIKIDLGMEPEKDSGMHPGDYILTGRKQKGKEALVGIRVGKLEELTAISKKLVQLDREMEGLENENLRRRLHNIVEELQDSVGEMRKTPVASVFSRMKLAVYDLSHKLAKEIRFEMEGEELLVDRLVAEQLAEPLMHMVRNAADHGIEGVEERRAAGKEPKGTIWLSARKKKHRLYLSVKNDGRELDARKIFERAKEKGFIEEGAKMEDFAEEAVFLMITRPGFSTVDTVTEISGRGIGMDIVASRVQELGGELRISNFPGKGVEMTMEVPVD